MLIALLYHKIGSGKYGNSLEVLEAHFEWIASHFSSVLPGDPLLGPSVCLTFDDAYFDFYHHIFPLLKTYRLKALLAVPTAYILNDTSLSPQNRLEEGLSFLTEKLPHPSPALCTWKELCEMAHSPFVQIASHSVSHQAMTSIGVDVNRELSLSKRILEKKLGIPISSFVYPFGKWNQTVHAIARKQYRYLFRIGNAANISWSNAKQLLYRIHADQLPAPTFPFTPFARTAHFIHFLFNICRGR